MPLNDPASCPTIEDLRELKDGIRRIHDRLDALDARYVRHDVSLLMTRGRDAELASIRAELADIRSRATWAWRAALTGVLFPIVVAVMVWIVTQVGVS